MLKIRCTWCGDDTLYQNYHDREWGLPVFDDQKFFEFIILEGAQAGLSFITILKKRENYRRLFANFEAAEVARFDDEIVSKLVNDPGIIRNRLKICSAIKNARHFLEIQNEFGSFSNYVWRFVEGEPVVNSWRTHQDIPAVSPESIALSKDLKSRGFSFVGPTIMYAFMQACGLVNDHLTSCFRYKEV